MKYIKSQTKWSPSEAQVDIENIGKDLTFLYEKIIPKIVANMGKLIRRY